jgi:hypothetical protein
MATRSTAKKSAAKKATAKKATAKKATAKKANQSTAGQIWSWQDDPGSPGGGVQPVQSPAPDPGAGTLPVRIDGRQPAPKLYDMGTAEFRYWVAAEALRRGSALFSALLPTGVTWFPTNGRQLTIRLDEGEDFNAYYDRRGLHFFHGTAAGKVVFSGESPDVACHEMGHAVLDALRPQLWSASFIEAGAFHEAFGDMAALMAALQLRSVREEVLAETSGHLYRSSRLSRVAEELGWALRQIRPELVDPDCLRNAVNSFFYQNPAGLPPSGPAATLSSEPHSFSRVFTAAFMESLAGIPALQPNPDQAGLQQASLDVGALLVDAVVASPVVPSYYSQIAAHMIEADSNRFGGRYGQVVKGAFVKHGILSLDSGNLVQASPAGAPHVQAVGLAVSGGGRVDEPLLPLAGARYGLAEDLLVPALAETKRFGVVGAAPDVGGVDSPSHDRAARSFVEDLFRRDKIDPSGDQGAEPTASRRASHLTHSVRRRPEGLVLVRESVDCGFDVIGR